jgi:hypothetical protein
MVPRTFLKSYYEAKNVIEDQFGLTSVTSDQMLNVLISIKAGKATGLDKLPARFVKDGANAIVDPLAHLFNLPIENSIVPNNFKTARVVPLYKKGSKTCCGNYRPVSILSVISKVFEKIVFNQLKDYLQSKNLLYNFQSGFRSNYSTDTCLIHLLDHITLQADQGNLTGMVVLDLQKAFDTVNHSILLDKISYGCK